MVAARILVVEDDPDNLVLVCFVLETMGFQLLPAADGRVGLEMAQTHSPDITNKL